MNPSIVIIVIYFLNNFENNSYTKYVNEIIANLNRNCFFKISAGGWHNTKYM